MRRIALLALGALTLASHGRAEPETPYAPELLRIEPYGAKTHASRCEPGKAVMALASGKSNTPLALYVFDREGRCVGWDDEASPAFDDRIVVWTPTSTGEYRIEFRNYGARINHTHAVFRGVSTGVSP